MRILIAKYEVAGYFGGLANALEQSDVDVSIFFTRDHPFYENKNTKSVLFYLSKKATNFREIITRRKFFLKLISVVLDEVIKFFLILKCAISYDIVIFSYGEDFSGRFYEPYILRWFKTKVYFFFLGSDIRPTGMSVKFQNNQSLEALKNRDREVHRIKKVLRRVINHRAEVVSYPAYSQLITQPYIDIFQFGLPVKSSVTTRGYHNKLRICHIPSDVVIKKTSEIEKILERAQIEFPEDIEIKIVNNIENSEVRKLLSESDIIITELGSDTPCPLIAIEACAEGCVPIVSGDFIDEFIKCYGKEFLPPYPYVSYDQVASTLSQLIQNSNTLEKLKIDCERYYASHHSTIEVGKKFRRFLIDQDTSEFLILGKRDE